MNFWIWTKKTEKDFLVKERSSLLTTKMLLKLTPDYKIFFQTLMVECFVLVSFLLVMNIWIWTKQKNNKRSILLITNVIVTLKPGNF